MTCQEKVSDHTGFHFYPCGRKAITGSRFCGIHDPARRAERAAKRGPSKWQRELDAKRDLRRWSDFGQAVAKLVQEADAYANPTPQIRALLAELQKDPRP